MRRPLLWILLFAATVLTFALGPFVALPDVGLYGAEPKADRPALTFDGWKKEEVQDGVKRWFESRIAFRGVLVRCDNTLFTLFGDGKPGSPVRFAENDTLFIDEDFWYASKRPMDLPSDESIAHLGELVGRVQKKLAARGKHVAVILSPGKTAFYPDAVPARWQRRVAEDPPPDVAIRRKMRATLARNGVKYGDATRFGDDLRAGVLKEEREVLFSRTGRHWTKVLACRAGREALDGVVPGIDCAYDWARPPIDASADYDLWRLANIWHFKDARSVPVLKERPQAGADAPRAVYVGTSFSFELAKALRPYLSQAYFLYYNTTVYDMTRDEDVVGPLDPKSDGYDKYVLDRDLYVLELLEVYAPDPYAVTFLETLDARLD